jgi:tetratricopeptide (TPR) repeat protein
MLNKNKEWLLAALILLVTLISFTPVLKSDFVNWDDDVNVTLNPNVQKLSGESLKNMFSTTVIGGYTPLTTLSFAVETSLFGMKPGVYHFNNLLLHLLCTLLVFIFLKRLGASLFVVFVTTLLFGIHPMRVESVAWITERKDVLYSFFFLLSLISYLAFYQQKKKVWYFLALLAFVFSLLSKIQAVALPLVLMLIDYYHEKRFTLRQLWNKTPFFILSLATGVAGILLLSREGSLETSSVMPFAQRIFIGTYSLIVYLVKAVVPYQLSAIYPNPETLNFLFFASAVLVVLLVAAIYKSGKYRNDLVFGSLFFLANVIFMLQIVGAGQAFLADRFTYLAYIGLFYLIARALNPLWNGRWKPVLLGAGIVILAGFAFLTWNRAGVWKNSETLFTDVIRKYPDVAMAHNNLGLWYRDNNQNEKAVEAYTRAIAINPMGHLGYNNRGEVWFEMGKTEEALEDMNKAVSLNPDYSKAWSNRGALRGSRKEYDQALLDLDRAIGLDSGNLQAYINRLLVHYNLGNYEKAAEDATTCLSLSPGNADVMNQRGLCYDKLNRNQEAMNDFIQSILLNPNKGSYYQNRSYLLTKMGDLKPALEDIRKARELGTRVNTAYVQMLELRVAGGR